MQQMLWEEEREKRKPFSTKTKKIEWMLAAGRNPYDKSGKLRFVKTSKCRVCKRSLIWEDRTYDFDHKDNNPANNRQTNCYLVCKVCHGKHTVIKKRKIMGFFGETVGHETIKKKAGYKRPKKPKKTKRVAIRDIFGDVIGYRTVKVRKTKTAKKKTAAKKTKKKTTPKKSKKKTTKPTKTARKKK